MKQSWKKLVAVLLTVTMLGALGDGAGLASAIWVLAALAAAGLTLSIGVAAIERRGAQKG